MSDGSRAFDFNSPDKGSEPNVSLKTDKGHALRSSTREDVDQDYGFHLPTFQMRPSVSLSLSPSFLCFASAVLNH